MEKSLLSWIPESLPARMKFVQVCTQLTVVNVWVWWLVTRSSQGVVAPPDPPADAVKNLPISKWPVPNVDPVTSSVTATSSTKPGDTTEKPTETPSETTETPPETTETPHEPTEKPSESTKAPEPEKDTGSGHSSVVPGRWGWFCLQQFEFD